MLKQRFLTALVLIPLVLLGIFKLPAIGFMLLTLLLVVVAGWEWSRLSGITAVTGRAAYCIGIVVIINSIQFNFARIFVLQLAFIAPLWWVFALATLFYFNRCQRNLFSSRTILCIIGLIVLIPCWLNLNMLRYLEPQPYILLFFLGIIWGSDIAAYFAGKAFGQHKLAPSISPKKTWEGVGGALIVTLILALVFINALHITGINALYIIMLSLLTAGFSIVGDLYESILKRVQGLKDSGNILPGHGGVMDRIDALVAAAPIFTLGYVHQEAIVKCLTNIAI